MESEEFLVHYGVKGMKWGVRKAKGESSTGERRLSRRKHRAMVKKERAEYYQKKAENILRESLKDPDVLVRVRTDRGTVVATGREFIDYMSQGGLMDIRFTDLYARKAPDGSGYEVNANMNRPYEPPKR